MDGVYPPVPWARPSLLVDSNFPNGVLNFSTASNFSAFYSAFETAGGASQTSNSSSGLTPFSASGTSSTTTNYATFVVLLNQGQVLELGTCDLEGSSFAGDTYLRLAFGGTEVAYNDDACGGTGSRISHTATSSGLYEVRMGCYSSGACSGVVSYSVSSPTASTSLGGVRTFSSTNTSSATTGYSTVVLDLTQGQVLDVGTCGVAGSSVSGDSYLRLVDIAGNVEVAINDDACGGRGSQITYIAERTGPFEVRLGCFSTGACSGTLTYTLTPALTQAQMLPASGFVSAKTYLDYARPGEQPGDAIYDVDYAEFTDDLKAYLTEDDSLRRIVDRDLQVVIEGRLYQLTNMGVFQVDMAAVPAYRAWLSANEYAMNTDPNFQSISGEAYIGDGSYQVMPGVIRTVGNFGTPWVKLLGFDNDGSSAETLQALGDFADRGATDKSPPPTLATDAANSTATSLGTLGAELGRISYWSGKVNAHKAAGGTWLKDADCSSGANIDPLTYCRKFFPGTTSANEVPVTTKPANLWNTAGCGLQYSGDGLREWICDGSSTPPPTSCNQTPPAINMPLYTVGSNFNRSAPLPFGNKRFVFKAQNQGFLLNLGSGVQFGFHKIDIKAKLQRKKRFLGIGYWGPSYGDEIVVGMDNMKVETDYIIPYPQTYNTLAKPKFNGLADYKIGNWVVKAANIYVNLKPPGPGAPITTQDVADWISGGLNSVIGGAYNDIWKLIEKRVMDAIDSTYNSRYAAYTKMVSDLNDAHKLRWVMGKGEKPQCYSHANTWWFDANGGFRFTQNGGVAGPPGTPPAQITYKYAMKSGSFYGRARVGSSWYGIRFVRTP